MGLCCIFRGGASCIALDWLITHHIQTHSLHPLFLSLTVEATLLVVPHTRQRHLLVEAVLAGCL